MRVCKSNTTISYLANSSSLKLLLASDKSDNPLVVEGNIRLLLTQFACKLSSLA